jgi:magnesium transporter
VSITARLFRVGSDEPETVELSDGLVRGLDERQLLWVDVVADPERQMEHIRWVDDLLGLDGALAERAEMSRTSIRFAHETVSLVVQGLADSGPDAVHAVPLHLVAAPNRVVSLHALEIPRLSEPIAVVASDPRFGRLDAGTFLGLLLDGMLDGYFSEVERIERVIDDLDERALRSDRADPLLDDMVAIRGRIARLRRALAPQREVFAALLRPVEAPDASPIGWPWPGLPERLDRALDAAEQAREQLLGSFDLVMTRTGQRTNDVMRVLTVVSAVLLPSIVIAGAMGMNFQIPFFDDPGNYLLVVVLMALLALLILGVARLRHWI